MLREDFPHVHVLQGDGRWWWTGAIHEGMRHAILNGADVICWLNDDTLPEPGALEMLVARVRESHGICGGVSRPVEEGATVYGGGVMRQRWPRALTLPETPARLPVEWLNGNMVAIHQWVWRKIGLPRTRGTIHNFADMEYTCEACRAGIPVELDTAARATARANFSDSYRSWRDDSLSWPAVWKGFTNPKVWWYLPGLLAFKTRLFGWRGLLDCFQVLGKAAALPFYKCLRTCLCAGKAGATHDDLYSKPAR
jgi:GT2 family glycosyltransferase